MMCFALLQMLPEKQSAEISDPFGINRAPESAPFWKLEYIYMYGRRQLLQPHHAYYQDANRLVLKPPSTCK